MKAVAIRSGVEDPDVDTSSDLKIEPGPDLFPIRSATISSNRGGWVLGHAEIYFERVEVRARCHFNSELPALDELVARGGRSVKKTGGGVFVALVKILPGFVSVSIDDQELPIISVTVEIKPDAPVEANVVFPDAREPGAWTPSLCRRLLEACGWEFSPVGAV